MTLTHDKVRSLLDEERAQLLFDWIVESGGDLSLLSDVLQVSRALAEEWLARNAARWDEEEPETLRCNEWFGHVRRSRHGLGYAWFAFSPDDESSPLATEAEARAWLEERAREADYEVAT